MFRNGSVDLEVGVIGEVLPETRIEHLLTDEMVAVVRSGHPLLDTTMTPESFVAYPHVSVSRRGRIWGPVDRQPGRRTSAPERSNSIAELERCAPDGGAN